METLGDDPFARRRLLRSSASPLLAYTSPPSDNKGVTQSPGQRRTFAGDPLSPERGCQRRTSALLRLFPSLPLTQTLIPLLHDAKQAFRRFIPDGHEPHHISIFALGSPFSFLPFTSRAMLLPWILPLTLFLSTVTPSHAHTASHHQLAEHAFERRAAATCPAGTRLVGSFWPAWLSGVQPPSKFPWSKNQLAFYFGALARWWKPVGTRADAFAETASISRRDYPRGYLSAWRTVNGRHFSIRQAGSSE